MTTSSPGGDKGSNESVEGIRRQTQHLKIRVRALCSLGVMTESAAATSTRTSPIRRCCS